MPRNSPVKAFRRAATYRALVIASAAGRALPLPLARAAGRVLGRIANLVVRNERRNALRHLAIAFPELSETERSRLTRRMFEHLGMALFEIAWLPNLNKDNLSRWTRFEGLEHLDAIVESGAGGVIFTAHCGNWEWFGAAVSMMGYDINVVARDIANERVNEYIVAARARHGVRSIGRGSAASAKELLRALKSGGFLGMLIDQSIRAENVDTMFFGQPAPTPVGAAKLAIRAGSHVIAGFAERGSDGVHLIRFYPSRPTSRDEDPAALTQEMTTAIEQQIRRVPEQWVWMHRRWRPR